MMTPSLRVFTYSALSAALIGACAESSTDEAAHAEQAATAVSSGSVTATLTTTSDWGSGFCNSVTISNTGEVVTNWTVTIATGGATISQIWSASQTTSGTTMTVTPAGYNQSIPSGGTVNFGFCGSGTGRPTLTRIAVTGGSGGTGGTSGTGGATAKGGTTSTGGTATCAFPTSFKWSSTGPLATPQSPSGHSFVSMKDFTVTKYNNQFVVYGSAFDSTTSAWTSVNFNFSDWTSVASATQTWVTRNAVAPTLFYFTPKSTWVLTYQWGFQYATSTTPNIPSSWSAGKTLLTGGPSAAIDQTVICDNANCYLFFAGDNGNIYRSAMAIGNFPGTFSGYTTILTDTTANLFEGVQVYSVKGTGKYLMIVEAMGSGGRYFRAFSSESLSGSWTAIAGASTEAAPFAGKNNVTFTSGTAWTKDISHGDLVRADPSEAQTVDPCNLQMLYQGYDKSVSVTNYNLIPYRPALLTKTN